MFRFKLVRSGLVDKETGEVHSYRSLAAKLKPKQKTKKYSGGTPRLDKLWKEKNSKKEPKLNDQQSLKPWASWLKPKKKAKGDAKQSTRSSGRSSSKKSYGDRAASAAVKKISKSRTLWGGARWY